MSFIRIKLGDFNGVVDSTIIEFAKITTDKEFKKAYLEISVRQPSPDIDIDFDEADIDKAEEILGYMLNSNLYPK